MGKKDKDIWRLNVSEADGFTGAVVWLRPDGYAFSLEISNDITTATITVNRYPTMEDAQVAVRSLIDHFKEVVNPK